MLHSQQVLSRRRRRRDGKVHARLTTGYPPRVVLCTQTCNLEPLAITFVGRDIFSQRPGEVCLSWAVVVYYIRFYWLRGRISILKFHQPVRPTEIRSIPHRHSFQPRTRLHLRRQRLPFSFLCPRSRHPDHIVHPVSRCRRMACIGPIIPSQELDL